MSPKFLVKLVYAIKILILSYYLGGFAHWSIIKAVYGILQLYIRFKNF